MSCVVRCILRVCHTKNLPSINFLTFFFFVFVSSLLLHFDDAFYFSFGQRRQVSTGKMYTYNLLCKNYIISASESTKNIIQEWRRMTCKCIMDILHSIMTGHSTFYSIARELPSTLQRIVCSFGTFLR